MRDVKLARPSGGVEGGGDSLPRVPSRVVYLVRDMKIQKESDHHEHFECAEGGGYEWEIKFPCSHENLWNP